MKRSLLLLAFLVGFHLANTQQIDSLPKTALDKKQLLAKSKSQKTVGWIMFGTGAPVVLGSLFFIITLSNRDFDEGTAIGVLAGSTVYTFLGYSLIRNGNKNKREALSLNLINNHLEGPLFVKSNAFFRPGLSLQLRF